MDKQSFAEIVSANFTEIQRNFRSGLKDKGYEYNEDLMNDAFISCMTALKDKNLTKQEAIKYYWTSYINKYKTWSQRHQYVPIPGDYEEIDDSHYDPTTDEIYNMIMEGLRDEFGVRIAYIWELHFCEGKTAKEIAKMGIPGVENYVYLGRKIKRFITKHIIPNNPRLKELIDCRKE